MSELVPISALAEVNPKTVLPLDMPVSFIGMDDVSESFAIESAENVDPRKKGPGYTRFQEGDLLFAKITPCMENGKGALAKDLTNGFALGSTEFHVLRCPDANSRAYLAQWLTFRLLRQTAETHMTGSAGQRRVPSSFFGKFLVPNPSSDQKLCIAKILDTLDDQIRSSRALIAKLRASNQGLIYDLISSHEPDTVLAEAIDGSPANGIYKPAELIGRGALLIGQTAFTSDRIVDASLARRATVSVSELSRFGVSVGDILVSRVFATLEGVGQPALVTMLPEPAVYESNMMRIKLNVRRADSLFVFNQFQIGRARAHVMRHANLSNQASISQSVLTRMPFWLPTLHEQLDISSVIAAANRQRDCERQKVAKLEALKVGLMTDLLTGRLDVPTEIPR
jgi:type I restriction enzyme S subunit